MAFASHAMDSSPLIALARDFYQDEIKDHDTYMALAERERNPELRAVLRHIAGIELKHSAFWQELLARRNAAVPQARTGTLRLATLRVLQRFISSAFLVSALELGESGAFAKYLECLRHPDLSDHERDQLRAIVLDEIEHEMTFRRESSKLGLSNVRDYVLGMNDGLVEILGVVTGLSAVYAGHPRAVGLSGVVVGIAGAMSMGIGAFISVRSQRQVNQALRERAEILFQVAPQRAVTEYQDRLAESGVPDDTAAEVAQRVGNNRDAIAHLLMPEAAENELRSGLYTGFAYLLGVIFPVLPYFVATSSLSALLGSVALAGIALALTATTVSVLSGISLRAKITEMIIAAFSAAAIAYLFGWALRATTGIEV